MNGITFGALTAAALLAVLCLLLVLRERALQRQIRELGRSRREVEDDALRKTEERRRELLESVFHALGDACLIVDRDLRILMANDRLRPLLGTTPAPAGRKLPDVIMDHRFVDLCRAGFERRAEVEETLEFARGGAEEDRRHLHLTVNVKPVRMEAGDSASHLRMIIRDISEQRETEQIRKDFVANASHELRTPLSIINGYIENLIDGVIDDPASIRKALLTMQKHGERIGRIVEDMLTISKFESTTEQTAAQLRASTFDCRECAQDVIERLAPVIEEKKARVEIDIPEGDRFVAGDRFYWDQIFFNLVENALKENRDEGLRIGITLRRLPNGGTRIVVKDDGVGIPRSDLPFVFKRFYRVAKHHSQEVKGTGLGLSIVKRAVEAHGGTIELASTPGVETSFTIVLPPAVGAGEVAVGSGVAAPGEDA